MTRALVGFIPPAVPVLAPVVPVAAPVVVAGAVAAAAAPISLPVAVTAIAGFGIGYLIGTLLAQLWGRLAGPPRKKSVTLADKTTKEVTSSTSKAYVWKYGYKNYEKQTVCATGKASVYEGGIPVSASYSRQCHGIRAVSAGTGRYASGCGVAEYVAKNGYFQLFDGVSWSGNVGGWGGNVNKQADVSVEYEWDTWIAELTIDGVPYVPPGISTPWTPPSSIAVTDQAAIAPSPLPLPEPVVEPAPIGEPIAEGGGGTAQGAVLPPLLLPGLLPLPSPGGRPILGDGTLAPVVKPLPELIPPDWTFPWPGSPPLVDNGPRPELDTIAKEMGKLEQKLEWLLRPPALPGDDLTDRLGLLMDLVRQLWTASTDGAPEGEYELTTPCDFDDQGRPVMRIVHWPQTDDNQSALLARMDALAALLQAHKDLKQPVCAGHKPDLAGEWVTVNFQSDDPSPSGEKRLRKRFRYRDQSAAPLEDHVAHWQDFAWDAGPVCVISKNLSWGVPQVWASSIAEGKRVITHAAQIAGVDLSDPKHEWVISGSSDPRYGQPGRMRVDTRGGRFLRITKRDGPNGLPTGLAPIP